MAKITDLEALFKKHSFEEIEALKDNLAEEIEKKTELLKSAVKEKYRDIVETSDAIQSMRENLNLVDKSLVVLDHSITSFYSKFRDVKAATKEPQQSNSTNSARKESGPDEGGALLEGLLNSYVSLWENFDEGDLNESVKILKKSLLVFKNLVRSRFSEQQLSSIDRLDVSFRRAEEMIRNYLWYKIENAEADQIGLIAASAHKELYDLSLRSSMQFICEPLKRNLFDTSYSGQIRRFQPHSYIDKRTNELDSSVDDLQAASGDYIHIPKLISPELNTFLCDVCRVVKTISGFNLNKSSIVDTLEMTIEHIIDVYSELEESIRTTKELRPEMRRKRALQLYYDLLYIKLFLNKSKTIDLIERLDPKLSDLAMTYESMLDPVELYTIMATIQSNVSSLCNSTIRVYGLLMPHLH